MPCLGPPAALAVALSFAAPLASPAPEELAYDRAKQDLETKRAELETAYRGTRSAAVRGAVLDRASAIVLRALATEILPAWTGTPWDFNGTSDRPGAGSIACGFFVGTVLAHAGFKLNRIALGRLASEHIAIHLAGEKNLRRYSGRPSDEVVRDVIGWGTGLYAVGLDNHAGLALVDREGKAWFIHSSYVGSGAVITEPLEGDHPFAWSRYRVLARLLDREMMKRWLLREKLGP